MEKNKGLFTLTMWWFIILAVTGMLILFFTPDRERISESEKRVLQNIPKFTLSSFLDRQFSDDFESFLSDSVPGREALVSVSERITGLMSLNTKEDMYYLDTTMQKAAEEPTDEKDKPDGEDAFSEQGTDSSEDSGKDESGKASGKKDAAFELLRRDGKKTLIYSYPEKNLRKTAENLDKIAGHIPDDGHVYLTFAPFSIVAFGFTDSPDVYSGWQCNHTERLNELTSDKVRCFDSLKILEPHMLDGEQMFLHVSHQWHVHAAYYVCSEMIRSQGLTPTPYEEYEYRILRPRNPLYTNKDTFELLYPLAPAHNYRVSSIDSREELPLMNYTYADNDAYLNGNVRPWHTVVTGFHTGRNALIIGDCFDRPFSTFLLPYYDELHLADLRYGYFDRKGLGTTVADMMKRNSINDVYVVFSEASGVNSKTMLSAISENLY